MDLSSEQMKDVCAYYLEKNIPVSDISTNANRLKRHSYMDSHNKEITLTSAEVDIDFSFTRSSYISMKENGITSVGRIMTIFQHVYKLQKTTFLCVLV